MIEQIGLLKEIEVKRAKEILREIYSDLGISRRAKARDLNKFFYTKEINKNGIRYIVLSQTKIADNMGIS